MLNCTLITGYMFFLTGQLVPCLMVFQRMILRLHQEPQRGVIVLTPPHNVFHMNWYRHVILFKVGSSLFYRKNSHYAELIMSYKMDCYYHYELAMSSTISARAFCCYVDSNMPSTGAGIIL